MILAFVVLTIPKSNYGGGLVRVLVRLDRAFANLSWVNLFCNSKVSHLGILFFDHYPITFYMQSYDPSTYKKDYPCFNPYGLSIERLKVLNFLAILGGSNLTPPLLSNLSYWNIFHLSRLKTLLSFIEGEIT